MAQLRPACLLTLIFLAASALAQNAPVRHTLRIDDFARFCEVRDPQLSPDGQWVAYVVSTIDSKEDKTHSHIWLASYDGKTERQLTFSQDSESSPRWSPDGKYLAFTSSRPGPAKGNQVWLLDRSGGEAYQLTEIKGHLQSFEWAPDSKRMALVIGDRDPDEPDPDDTAAKKKAPNPIVIDRYKYKQDVQGYLLSGRHNYIYLFDLGTKKLERLTKGTSDESMPVWSPDGKQIAYLDNHSKDPDREADYQVFVTDAKPGSPETQLTPNTSRGSRSRPQWSPDGKWVAFLEGDERKYDAYNTEHLALVPSDGSAMPHRVAATEALDRDVSLPRFSPDSRWIYFLVSDDRSVYPARVKVSGGDLEKLMKPPVVISSWNEAAGHEVAVSGGDDQPNEIFALENGERRQISHQNDALMAELEIGKTQDVNFQSKDGTEVHGLLTTPVGYVAGTRVPLLLRIHGGPHGQDQHSWSAERQWFAANGYAVLAVNYRGSSGRGKAYARAIFADWGHYEVEDLEAGVNHVIQMGIADPQRLGVGGWSYGGILTDYMIASDPRFKAATSGAGTAFTVAFYGTDQYIIQYDYEIGPPWEPKAWETYQKISYPFLHADRIKTPTLFLGGEKDFNVPVQGGQQMYEALKSLGIETQLIIYPDQFHGFTRPSYIKDRYERYLSWYDKHLKGTAAAGAAGK